MHQSRQHTKLWKLKTILILDVLLLLYFNYSIFLQTIHKMEATVVCELWDISYDDSTIKKLAKKHDMVISSQISLIIPKWDQTRYFNTSEELKQFVRLYDSGAFDHLSRKDFHENALYGAGEIMRASRQEERKSRTS